MRRAQGTALPAAACFAALLLAAVLLEAMLESGAGWAADWPQWRGPGSSGVSSETGLPERWSASEGLRWKADLPGRGVSGPVVARGRVYVTACSGAAQDRLHVLCFEASSGAKRWERQLWATGLTACHPKTSMAAPTPAAAGARVYALFATCDLAAFDEEGTLAWYRSLALDYPDATNQVGMASSPVPWRDLLIVALETDSDSSVLAIDARTGRNRWRTPRARGINWATPLVARLGAVEELILQSHHGVAAYDPGTGGLRWTHEAPFDTIASPVEAAGTLFAPAGDVVALRPGAPGGKPEVLWRSNKLRASTASPLAYEGRVYAVSSAGVLSCADPADGSLLWQERLEGPLSASPAAGDGKIYCVNEEGTTIVVSAGPEHRVLAKCPLGETILASPAISCGGVFLRSDAHLFCAGK